MDHPDLSSGARSAGFRGKTEAVFAADNGLYVLAGQRNRWLISRPLSLTNAGHGLSGLSWSAAFLPLRQDVLLRRAVANVQSGQQRLMLSPRRRVSACQKCPEVAGGETGVRVIASVTCCGVSSSEVCGAI